MNMLSGSVFIDTSDGICYPKTVKQSPVRVAWRRSVNGQPGASPMTDSRSGEPITGIACEETGQSTPGEPNDALPRENAGFFYSK